MGDLLPNYSRWEFACQCGCGYATVDYQLGIILQDLHEYLQRHYPEHDIIVDVHSGCRCVEHNESEQKEVNPGYIPYSSDSMHLYGRAADISVRGIEPQVVYGYLITRWKDRFGFGLYLEFVHADSRYGVWRQATPPY